MNQQTFNQKFLQACKIIKQTAGEAEDFMIIHEMGFYKGYCAAMGWEPDLEIMAEANT